MTLRRLLSIVLAVLVIVSTGCASIDRTGPYFRVKESGKWGFINSAGQMVISPQYDNCFYQFSEDLVPVEVSNKWGYIDRDGRFVIPPQHDSAQSFKDGLAAVSIGEPFEGQCKYGYIDKSGRYVLELNESFSYCGFSDGLMKVKKGMKWGYIDTKGNWAIPHEFMDADDFSSGLAGVRLDEKVAGYINTKGEWVIRLDSALPHYEGFAENLAPVLDCKSGKLGFINKAGIFVIPPQFDQASSFHEGRAAVCIVKEDATGWPQTKWGAINTAGEVVIPIKYETLWPFSEGMSKVADNHECGFVNLDGELAIPCMFRSVDPFENGLAFVTVGDFADKTGWSGYINKQGDFVWRPSDFKARDKARESEKNREPTIKVFNDRECNDKGLLVTCTRKVPRAGENAGKIIIQVVNLMEEEVFLEVTDFESLGYSVETRGGGYAGSGGSFTFFPDNTHLLKRLHATSYSNGKPFTCGCCMTQIKGSLAPEALELGPAKGTIDVCLSGYYRNTGRHFSECIKLPFEIIEKEEAQQTDKATTQETTPCATR